MSSFDFPYCPKCWPTYAHDQDAKGRCINCLGEMRQADKDTAIALLEDLAGELGKCLSEAHGMLNQVLGNDAPKPMPKLRLVHDADSGGEK